MTAQFVTPHRRSLRPAPVVRPGLWIVWLAAVLYGGHPDGARGQSAGFTFAVRGVPLAEALATFSNTTGTPISYDPRLVAGAQSYCTIEDAAPESVLGCLLEGTHLDFVRLSSGTYVLVPETEDAVEMGSVTGLVVDGRTGRPLPDAHVYLAALGTGSITNEAGRFNLPPLLPGWYEVRSSYVGYHEVRDTLWVKPGERAFARISLRPEPILVSPIVVDGTESRLSSQALTHERVEVADARDQASTVRGRDWTQRLRALPGVRINDVTADAHVQGSEAGAHQFRLDGAPLFFPQQSIGSIGPFSPFALERITVHKAGFGVRKGSQIAGVIEAEHALEAENALDVQLDPVSLNTRVAYTPEPGDVRRPRLMGAFRLGLWDLYRPPALESTLSAWSVPDPFLIFAPLRSYKSVDPSFFEETLQLRAFPRQNINFSDAHLAARLPLGPLRGLYVSFYQGHNRLNGSLLRGETQAVMVQAPDQEGDIVSEWTLAPFTVRDDYAWTNRMGQARYHAVLGARTLLNVQARASTYSLEHAYQNVDSLATFVAAYLRASNDGGANPPENAYSQVTDASKDQVDRNALQEWALSATVDYAGGQHHLVSGVEALYNRSSFDFVQATLAPIDSLGTQIDTTSVFAVYQSQIQSSMEGRRLAAFLEDRITLSRRLTLEAGLRLTYLVDGDAYFAEPRTALLFDAPSTPIGNLSMRTALGLYRQFLHQLDVSTLNAGALFPSFRIWIPIDTERGPPRALHASHSVLVSPAPSLSFRVEGFYKYQPHGLTLGYLTAGQDEAFSESGDFGLHFAETRGVAYGASMTASWSTDRFQASAIYEYNHAWQRGAELFQGARVPVPWLEPHRIDITVGWTPSRAFAASLRWQGIWKRPWAFREAYYDFFGHRPDSQFQPPYDFGVPGSHLLPPFYQLDVSMAYARPLGNTHLQVRLDLLNVLDRSNELDWRLIYQDGDLVRDPRLSYPILPSLAVRLSL